MSDKRVSRKERSLKRLLEHICAYCGYSKSDRPPLWCVREHEVWSTKQDKLKADLWEADHG